MKVIAETTNKQPVGATLQHRFMVTDDDGNPISDPTLALLTEYPDDTTTNHSVGDGTLTAHVTVGTYDIDIILSLVGDHFVTIKPTDGDWHVLYVPVGE